MSDTKRTTRLHRNKTEDMDIELWSTGFRNKRKIYTKWCL
jgi:hypothetical protein